MTRELSYVMRIAFAFMMFVTVIFALSLTSPKFVEAWLHPGPTVQYPEEGGKWTYGFWFAMARSWYYHPDVSRQSAVEVNGKRLYSVCTRAGQEARAEKGAINLPWWDDAYYYSPYCVRR
ncbi:MAG: hypothetical protein IMX03_07455 [Brockia lithotrophica]|nr:hypothetical protein [Brockia lithotrophica]